MAIEISNVTPAVGEIIQNGNVQKKKDAASSGNIQSSSDKVSISGDAAFISNLRGQIGSSETSSPSKISDIIQKIASGTYADSSKIAEGLINSLSIFEE
ncbi:MAG: flagellar biosynthesis anti-sigma factor FlgM [Candidatus Acidulodesulfobacterium sp.]